jgi:hypothetical protein
MSGPDLKSLAELESDAPLVSKIPNPFAMEITDLVPPQEDPYGFKPKGPMYVAKQRLKEYLRINPTASNISLDEICKITMTQRVRVWIEKYPKFLIWFIDLEYEAVRMAAYKEQAIDVAMKIMTSRYQEKVLTAKDKLKAAEIMLQITGAYPQKVREVKVREKEEETQDHYSNLDDEQVKSELKKTKERMLHIQEKG